MKQKDKPVITPGQLVNTLAGKYDGAELRPNPGLPADRMEAYRLPSIRGGWRIWPNGMRERIK